ncbi:MAG: HEPN domain-containing protein [Candidatus Diapherotrites archaeon]
MNIEDCLREGLLVKQNPDGEKAELSVEMAEHKLGLAEQEFEHEIFENAIVTAYNAMFHAARALLFRDGFKERSHFAVYVFVNEKYGAKIEKKYLNELQSLRLYRHDLTYGLGKPAEIQETEADSAIKVAKGFIAAVKKTLEEKPQNKAVQPQGSAAKRVNGGHKGRKGALIIAFLANQPNIYFNIRLVD